MPRLDAERVALWRTWSRTAAEVQRRVDHDLRRETGVPLAWFDVLVALAAAGGSRRVHELCEELVEVPSSLSRRLDRMEAERLVGRSAGRTGDGRAVVITLTARGRQLWRSALVHYRRAVQEHFATVLTDTDIAALHRVLGKLPTDRRR